MKGFVVARVDEAQVNREIAAAKYAGRISFGVVATRPVEGGFVFVGAVDAGLTAQLEQWFRQGLYEVGPAEVDL